MKVNEIWLNDHMYRYSVYKNHQIEFPLGVFLIGNLQEIESVEFFSEYFSKYLNLYVVEVPGTGLTNPLSATYSIQEQAKLLKEFLIRMGIPYAHLLAFSYATPVALELCLAWENIITLSMCGGMAGIPEPSRLDTMAILGDAIRNRKKFADAFIDGLTVEDKSIPRGKAISRSARQKVHKYTENQIRCFCENTVRILSYSPSDLSKIDIPCLLFIGKEDPYVTEKNALDLVNKLPFCEFEMIENADHLVHLEFPEKTANLMVKLAKEYSGLSSKSAQIQTVIVA
ncbi:alpha/beta hydrolase [Teredinibacter sp. KSP-S5-2]|uniref:alpha/beta fold hydrolase n=1 Tax=Teredinibacter sp. KSP-S5-2 TaxID=3034506 RepID=UPI00293445BB|nr:alpha/beta hydrolase [Teredinibacter sp. KSP-S5-2]WNO10570.1 alpha/beta hydrolase [Teredinibacter sp. KSP-S5-2]